MSEWIKKLAEGYKTVNENQKAALQKKLAKSAQSSEKGKKAVTLPKAPFEIPEDVPVDERDMFMARAAAAHKAGKSHFTMPGGKKHPVTMKKDTAQAVNKEAADLNKDNADAAIKHDCATHVEHAEWGEGQPISEMHTIVETAPGVGYVTHYDVMFEHGIEKNVAVEDLKILAEMSHGHAKKKNEMSSKEKMKRGLYNSTNEAKKEETQKEMHGEKGSMMRDRLKKKMSKNEEEEIVMNPKKEKKEKGATSDEAGMAAESVTPRVYSRILEARGTADKDGKHYKKASDSEEMDSKDSPGGKQMRKDMEGPKMDDPEQGDQMTKAANAAPSPQMRKGDNKAGDKKIIPSATPTKGM